MEKFKDYEFQRNAINGRHLNMNCIVLRIVVVSLVRVRPDRHSSHHYRPLRIWPSACLHWGIFPGKRICSAFPFGLAREEDLVLCILLLTLRCAGECFGCALQQLWWCKAYGAWFSGHVRDLRGRQVRRGGGTVIENIFQSKSGAGGTQNFSFYETVLPGKPRKS